MGSWGVPRSDSARRSGVFIDDDGIPAERAIEWLGEQGVLDGCDPPHNRRICPERVLNRAEAAKILVLLGRSEGVVGRERPGAVDHFVDDDNTWAGAAEQYLDHLADLGIVHGCDPPANHRICPTAGLLRGQIAKMLVRTFDLRAPDSYVSPWTDTQGQFYHAAARIAAFHGIWDSSTGRFGGGDVVLRAEFARSVVAAVEPGLCPDDPFRLDRVASLQDEHPAVSFTAYAFDLETECAYWMNPDSRGRTASVFKVMVMAGTLLEAQQDGRGLTGYETSLLEPMITESANQPVRDLWAAFGGDPWFARQAEVFGLDQTEVVGDHFQGPWGRTTTSGLDQANLLRQVLLGHWGPLQPVFRHIAFDLMTSVVPTQTWGVTEGVPSGWTVAQKNGFAGGVANSVGVIYDQTGTPDYVAVVLTQGWPSWQQGVSSVEKIGSWMANELAG